MATSRSAWITCLVSNRKFTVLQMLPALHSGGVERGTLEVARHLVHNGHRSLVMSAGGRLVEQLQREGSEHIHWQIGKKTPWTLRLIWQLRRLLRDEKVDILHVRSRMPGWLAYLAWKGLDPATRPHLVTTVHGLYSVSRYSAVMMQGERIIAVSESVRRYILNNYPSTDAGRIVLIPRGVDPAEFPHGYQPSADWLMPWNSQYPQLQGQRVLTLPGRLTRLKGHEDLIELIRRLKARGLPVHGLIVGGEDPKRLRYAEEIRRKVAENGLAGDITFTGHRSDLREIMAVSDIVFSLSSKPESFGRTTLEALSLGVPVIGYHHGGVGDILQAANAHGAVPLGDMERLVDEVIHTLGEHTEVSAPANLTLDAMLGSTLGVYSSLMSGKNGAVVEQSHG